MTARLGDGCWTGAGSVIEEWGSRASVASLLSRLQSRYPWRDMAVEQTAVLDALRVVKDPDLHRDIVSLGFIKNLRVNDGRVAFTIELTTPACPVKDQMRDQARTAVMQVPGVSAVDVQMSANVRAAAAPDSTRALLPGVKNVIAVGAGRGGVGKTTVAVNVAIALAKCGGRV